jgi:amylosucrase
VYNYKLHRQIKNGLQSTGVDIAEVDNLFYTRFVANASAIKELFDELYGHRADSEVMFHKVISTIAKAYCERSVALKEKDEEKEGRGHWFLSNEITGMSLYVDRFCGNLENLGDKLSYFRELGVNFLHLMPIF